jgi:hypothetical protein
MLEQIDVIDPIVLHVIREPIVFSTILGSWFHRGRSPHRNSDFLQFFKVPQKSQEAQTDPDQPCLSHPDQTNNRCPEPRKSSKYLDKRGFSP